MTPTVQNAPYEVAAPAILAAFDEACQARKAAIESGDDAAIDAADAATQAAIAPLSLMNTHRDMTHGLDPERHPALRERIIEFHVQAGHFRHICKTIVEARLVAEASAIVEIAFGGGREDRFTIHPAIG